MRRTLAVLGAVTVLALAAGCGGGWSSSGGSSGGSGSKTLTVDAASSLTGAFTDLAATFSQQHPGWKVVNNFAGTDMLAAQVEAGQKADVFAGASPKFPLEL
jgi:molybdate transport system substrate-binding protein